MERVCVSDIASGSRRRRTGWPAWVACALAMAAPAIWAGPSPTPAPRISVGSAPILQTIVPNEPDFSPHTLDFPAVSNGQSSRRTLLLAVSTAGVISTQGLPAPFRIAEFREMTPVAFAHTTMQAPSTPRTVKSRVTYPSSQTGPLAWSVSAHEDVEIDVVFEPKFDLINMVAGPKSAVLRLAGPGPHAAWSINVPLSGMFNGLKIAVTMALSPREVVVSYGTQSANVTATIVGIDGAAGNLVATKLPFGVWMTSVPVTVGKAQTVKPTLKFTFDWDRVKKDAIDYDGEITFQFPGGSSKATLSFVGLPTLELKSKKRSDCGVDEFNFHLMLGWSSDQQAAVGELMMWGNNTDIFNSREIWGEARTGGQRILGDLVHFPIGFKGGNLPGGYDVDTIGKGKGPRLDRVTHAPATVSLDMFRAAVRNGVTFACQPVTILGPPEAQ